jgi:hypothetical protein
MFYNYLKGGLKLWIMELLRGYTDIRAHDSAT